MPATRWPSSGDRRGLTRRSRRRSQGESIRSKRTIAWRCGPRRATNFGSHGVRRPASSCRPIRIASGPLTAPPTPGIGMNAGSVATNSSMPKARSPRPANTSLKRIVPSGSPAASAASSTRVPGGRGGLASSPAARSAGMVGAGRGDLLQQQLVDPWTVEVDDLDPPAVPLEVLADVGDAAELGDDHAGGGVVLVLVLQRQGAGAEQFAQVVHREAAVDQQRAVIA